MTSKIRILKILKTKRAGVMESKLVYIIITLVAVVVIIVLYIAFKESGSSALKYAMNEIFSFG